MTKYALQIRPNLDVCPKFPDEYGADAIASVDDSSHGTLLLVTSQSVFKCECCNRVPTDCREVDFHTEQCIAAVATTSFGNAVDGSASDKHLLGRTRSHETRQR